MSVELIGILAVGATLLVGLGGLVLTLHARTDKRLDSVDGELRSDIRSLAERVAALERGQARLEGLIEGSGLFRPAGAPEPSKAAGD